MGIPPSLQRGQKPALHPSSQAAHICRRRGWAPAVSGPHLLGLGPCRPQGPRCPSPGGKAVATEGRVRTGVGEGGWARMWAGCGGSREPGTVAEAGDRVRTESGARMVTADKRRKATQEATAGMQGRDGAWLLMRAEKTGKQPGSGHGGDQYPPHAHSPACPPFCNPSKGSLKLLGNSSRGTVYDWAYIHTINV